MHIRTILNRVQKHKGFVYGAERLIEQHGLLILEIPIQARRGRRAICSCFRHVARGLVAKGEDESAPFAHSVSPEGKVSSV